MRRAADAFFEADLCSPEKCERVINRVLEKYGRIDVLINNAAAGSGPDKGDIAAVPVEAWDRLMNISLDLSCAQQNGR